MTHQTFCPEASTQESNGTEDNIHYICSKDHVFVLPKNDLGHNVTLYPYAVSSSMVSKSSNFAAIANYCSLSHLTLWLPGMK